MNWILCEDPATVVTANDEVQTNEQAQVYVHDLYLFVTMELLDDMPAVLSLGKLCEEPGHSSEWVSGQQPQLTKNGHKITSKTDNFVPLVVTGLSSSSGSSSSSTFEPQDQSNNSGETESVSSDPVIDRRDEPAEGTACRQFLTNWLWETTSTILKTRRTRKNQRKKSLNGCRTSQQISRTWKHVPAHISERENSDSESFTKVVD